MNTLLIEEKFQLQIKEKVSIRPSVSVFQGIYKDNYVAIKIYDEQSTFIRETDSISRLYDKGVEVPKIINEGNINDSTYIMIQEWWNGIPLKERVKDLDRHTYKKILFDVGKLLAKVHFSLPYDELKEAVFWRRLEFNKFEDFTWNTYLNSLVDKWVANIRLNDKDKSIKLQEYLQFIHLKIKDITEPRILALLHCDYTSRNIIVNNTHDSLLGVLDFELVLLGDPLYDIAKMTWVDLDDIELQEKFLNGWETHSNLSIDYKRFQLYQAIQAIAAISWVDRHMLKKQEFDSYVLRNHEWFRKRAIKVLIDSCSVLS